MPELKNFRKVTTGIYRGGQPNRAALVELAEKGFKTVVSFRWQKRIVNQEKRDCKDLGLDFVSIPLNYSNPPSLGDIKNFLNVLEDSRMHPVFVHCLHGKDRTGIMVAIYRIIDQEWSVQEAYKEMEECGFHKYRLRPFKWHLFKFANNLEKNLLLLKTEKKSGNWQSQ